MAAYHASIDALKTLWTGFWGLFLFVAGEGT